MKLRLLVSRLSKARVGSALALCLLPQTSAAHDAFGDLGPYYASLLHPLADPLQAALLVGTAAFIAQKPLEFSRVAIPVFVAAAGLAALSLMSAAPFAVQPVIGAVVVLVAGLAAMLPQAVRPKVFAFALIAVAGAVTGLAPGAFNGADAVQSLLGTFAGIAALVLLAWYGLEAMGRHLSWLAPKVAGSWVAAIGILVAAFSM